MLYSMLAGVEDDIWPSNGEIQGAASELQARTKALAVEVGNWLAATASSDAQQAFITAWNLYIDDIATWDPGKTFYFDRIGRRNELLAFRKRFAGLQDWFKTQMGRATGTPEYSASELPTSSPWPSLIKWSVIALVGGLVLYGGLQVYSATKTARALSFRSNPRRRRR